MKADLETILCTRHLPPASEDFAERILALSAHLPQQRAIRISDWLGSLFGEFMLPRPAYALASMLLLGLLVGIGVPANDATAETASYGYEEGGIL